MRRDEASIDQVAMAIVRSEEAIGHKGFKRIHREQTKACKNRLDKEKNARAGKPLARATAHSTLSDLGAFFIWLAGQLDYKSRISYADADYFSLSKKICTLPRLSAKRLRRRLIRCITCRFRHQPERTLKTQSRYDCICLVIWRVSQMALASLRLKHGDLEQGCVL